MQVCACLLKGRAVKRDGPVCSIAPFATSAAVICEWEPLNREGEAAYSPGYWNSIAQARSWYWPLRSRELR